MQWQAVMVKNQKRMEEGTVGEIRRCQKKEGKKERIQDQSSTKSCRYKINQILKNHHHHHIILFEWMSPPLFWIDERRLSQIDLNIYLITDPEKKKRISNVCVRERDRERERNSSIFVHKYVNEIGLVYVN